MFAALLAGLLPAMAGCQPAPAGQERSQASVPAAPVRLKCVRAERRVWPRLVRVQGSLVGDENVVVGAKIAGRVEEVKVDMGSLVRRGDVLTTPDAEELELKVRQAQAQLDQARARLGLDPGEDEAKLDRQQVPAVLEHAALRDEARSNLERAKSLYAQQAISVEELQQREAELAVAEARCKSALNGVEEQIAQVGLRAAELALAREIQQDATVRAPFDGIVEARHTGPGAYLQVGQPVVSLVRIDPLRFRGGVPEREATRLHPRQNLQLTIEGLPEPVAAQLTRISPALDPTSRSLVIEVDLPNPGAKLRAGLFAEAEIVVDPDARRLAVPLPAITEFAGVEKVWRVRQEVAIEQIVQTGLRNDRMVEILSGIEEGDLVAADPSQARPGKVVVVE